MQENARCLLAYRADPSDRTFARVAAHYRPWVRSNGAWVLRRFEGLRATAELDDVSNEGLLALSRSARRYVHLCDRCGEPFLEGRALRRHALAEHRVRGTGELVSLPLFCETSARLAMKRTYLKSVRPLEYPDESVEAVPEHLDVEDRLLVELALRRADARLRGGLSDLLGRLLRGDGEFPPAAVRLLVGVDSIDSHSRDIRG